MDSPVEGKSWPLAALTAAPLSRCRACDARQESPLFFFRPLCSEDLVEIIRWM